VLHLPIDEYVIHCVDGQVDCNRNNYPPFESSSCNFDHALNKQVKEGERATFTCQLTGIPEPEVVWLHNSRPVGTGDRYVVTKEVDTQTCTLQVNGVTLNDAGTVEVIATNQFGRATCDTTLDVEGFYTVMLIENTKCSCLK
jgi:hypothetical protein